MKKMWDNICKDVKSMAVVGDTRTGKTALVYAILPHFDKTIYVFKHPKPELIEQLGFNNIYTGLAEIENLEDCVLWMDEPQLYIKVYQGQANRTLRRMLTLCGQKNVTLILSTAESRFITRGLESYINVWLIKDLMYDTLKQGSRIKKIIQDVTFIAVDGFSLDINEYVFWSRIKKYRKYNKKHTFEKPTFFTEGLSRPYYSGKTPKETPTKTANQTPKES